MYRTIFVYSHTVVTEREHNVNLMLRKTISGVMISFNEHQRYLCQHTYVHGNVTEDKTMQYTLRISGIGVIEQAGKRSTHTTQIIIIFIYTLAHSSLQDFIPG